MHTLLVIARRQFRQAESIEKLICTPHAHRGVSFNAMRLQQLRWILIFNEPGRREVLPEH